MSGKIVLDLETKKSFGQVENRRLDLMGVSVVGIYSYSEGQYKNFLEKDLNLLEPYLKAAEFIIGFNIIKFDFPVLQPYFNFDLTQLKKLDIFTEVESYLGHRLGLNALAQATLNHGKSATGLDALKYFRAGEIDQLIKYCQQDVQVTRELYEYGKTRGHLLYRRALRLETIPVSWAQGQTVSGLIEVAFREHRTLEIEYSSTNAQDGRRRRQIDIYALELGRIVGFCHLRVALRTFNIRRILSAKLTERQYSIPSDFNSKFA
ncbi:WYL domain-containing protein [Candidatus Omnitrophota bacterium]